MAEVDVVPNRAKLRLLASGYKRPPGSSEMREGSWDCGVSGNRRHCGDARTYHRRLAVPEWLAVGCTTFVNDLRDPHGYRRDLHGMVVIHLARLAWDVGRARPLT